MIDCDYEWNPRGWFIADDVFWLIMELRHKRSDFKPVWLAHLIVLYEVGLTKQGLETQC